jgi:hypothetical protein
VCGDGVCVTGEQCLDAECSNPGGCRRDCPHPLITCQASLPGGRLCSGHGVCIHTTGSCECFGGYTGESCQNCLPGYRRLLNVTHGECIKLPSPGCTDGYKNFLEVGVQRNAAAQLLANVACLMACRRMKLTAVDGVKCRARCCGADHRLWLLANP